MSAGARGGARSRRGATGAPLPRAGPLRPTVVLCIPSQTSFLGLVRDVTKRIAEAAGFQNGLAEQLALAVDEATTNVLEHAYHGATDRMVEVRLEDRGSEFRAEVVDSGSMVDLRSIPEVDLERYRTERRTGGLGIHLMGKIMDSVTFRRSARRNVCCLVKRKPAPPENPA